MSKFEYVANEKKNLKVIFKTNGNIKSENHQMLKIAKEKVIAVASCFNISLSISQEVDSKLVLKDDEVAIEYFSKAKPHESISANFLDFLDKFLDIGHENKINTYPMD